MDHEEIIAMAQEAGLGTLLPAEMAGSTLLPATWVGTHHGKLERFAALVAAKEREACDKWRQAIDHEMVVAHLGVAKPEDDPAALLRQVIQWHVDVALDPAVSGQARRLVEAEREACAAVAADTFYGNPGELNHEIAAAIRARGTKEGA